MWHNIYIFRFIFISMYKRHSPYYVKLTHSIVPSVPSSQFPLRSCHCCITIVSEGPGSRHGKSGDSIFNRSHLWKLTNDERWHMQFISKEQNKMHRCIIAMHGGCKRAPVVVGHWPMAPVATKKNLGNRFRKSQTTIETHKDKKWNKYELLFMCYTWNVSKPTSAGAVG